MLISQVILYKFLSYGLHAWVCLHAWVWICTLLCQLSVTCSPIISMSVTLWSPWPRSKSSHAILWPSLSMSMIKSYNHFAGKLWYSVATIVCAAIESPIISSHVRWHGTQTCIKWPDLKFKLDVSALLNFKLPKKLKNYVPKWTSCM